MKIDMEELIKEAERLYKQIDKIQLDLIKFRLDVCEEQKWKAISEMETIMCDVFQFLKCLIDRKDNIVDLGEVWHDITEPTERKGYVLLCKHPKFIEKAIQGQKIWGEDICKGAKYAYLEELFPKGGEK